MPVSRGETRLTDEMIERYTRAGYWGTDTLVDAIERNVRLRGDAEAFVGGNTRITWNDLWARSGRIAAGLQRQGVRAGDVVALQLPNRVEFVHLIAAIARIGAIQCQFPPDYRTREVRRILTLTEARAVIVIDRWKGFDHVAMIDSMRDELPLLDIMVSVGDDVSSRPGWQRFDELQDEADPTPVEIDPNDVCRITFTSGTTGDSKAALHTNNTTMFTCTAQNTFWGTDETERMLVFMPVGNAMGLYNLYQTCVAGGTAVLLDDFSPTAVLDLVERERITTFVAPPTAFIAILDHVTDGHELSSLRGVQTAGAPMPIELLRAANRRLGCPVVDFYGMMEMGFTSCSGLDESFEEWVGSVGRPYPWMGIRVLDENGQDVPPGAQGEIAANGPSICVGYYRNPEQNAAAWTEDGWFRSGDLARIDGNGRMFLTGRIKDVILHGGANVWPGEIEDAVATHPDVREAAVIGVPDEYFGENICVCVVPRAGAEPDLESLVSFLDGVIAKNKLPQQVVLFDEFPTGPTGKVAKDELRRAMAERASRSGV